MVNYDSHITKGIEKTKVDIYHSVIHNEQAGQQEKSGRYYAKADKN